MKLMILDGNSIINRAFYGVRLLTTVFVPMHARQRYRHSGQTQPKSMPSD